MRVEEVQSTGKSPQCMKKGDLRLSTVLLRPTCCGFQRVERQRLHNVIWLAQPFFRQAATSAALPDPPDLCKSRSASRQLLACTIEIT